MPERHRDQGAVFAYRQTGDPPDDAVQVEDAAGGVEGVAEDDLEAHAVGVADGLVLLDGQPAQIAQGTVAQLGVVAEPFERLVGEHHDALGQVEGEDLVQAGGDGPRVPEGGGVDAVTADDPGVELGADLLGRQGVERGRAVHGADDQTDVAVDHAGPDAGAAPVLVAHGGEVAEAEAAALVVDDVVGVHTDLEAELGEGLPDAAAEERGLALREVRELGVPRCVVAVPPGSSSQPPHACPPSVAVAHRVATAGVSS